MSEQVSQGAEHFEIEALGERIRRLRHARQLSLAELAQQAGHSTGFQSQIEKGVSLPSLTTLASIAAVLQTDLRAVLDFETESDTSVVHRDTAQTLTIGGPDSTASYRVYRGRGVDGASFGAVVETMQPTPHLHSARAEGERVAVVLSGNIVLTVRGQDYHLAAGDCLHYSTAVAQRRGVEGEDEAEVLWITDPPVL